MPRSAQESERERIFSLIKHWNNEHLELFTVSQPNEFGEFYGVIRFFFQDDGAKVSTKCIRVSSTATVREIIDVLVEKFRPDMRMLTPSSYSLYEVHVSGDETKLEESQHPLHVQLEWGSEGIEGRFLLKKDTETRVLNQATVDGEQNPPMKRKLSKREKKEQKKRDKQKLNNENKENNLAASHYKELPETNFTRSISNPDAVMKRRRQQKLDKKLQAIVAAGGPNAAGTLRVYGEQLNPDILHKTLLLSASNDTKYVIKEALIKYGLEKEDPNDFILVEKNIPPHTDYHGGQMDKEYILKDDDCPLALAMAQSPKDGVWLFCIRRKSVEQKLKSKTMRAVSHEDLRYSAEDKDDKSSGNSKLPFLVELYPDGTQNLKAKRLRIPFGTTKIGSDPKFVSDQNFLIIENDVEALHCVINQFNDGSVTLKPDNDRAKVFLNNTRVKGTVYIDDGCTLGIGHQRFYKFRNLRQLKGQPPEMVRAGSVNTGPVSPRPGAYETTFDDDGRVETSQNRIDAQNRSPGYLPEQVADMSDALPVALEFRDDIEDDLLTMIVYKVNDANVLFKLAPTYSLYMAVRFRLSTAYHPDMLPDERARQLVSFLNKIASMVDQTIHNKQENPAAMSFWMANASELLHFFKQDQDIHPFSTNSREQLAKSVQLSFHYLAKSLQFELNYVMSAFIDPDDDVEKEDSSGFQDGDTQMRKKPYINDILNTLSSAMHLLRRCRVNAALTIQLFSQLFHFINLWLFNTLVTQMHLKLCTYAWGVRLKRRLRRVETWAEEQGLELAADCHLCRIIQAAHLLQAPKTTAADIDSVCSSCFKLNSIQLQVLLENYLPEPDEPPVPDALIAKVVHVAKNMADAMILEEGREVHLEEDADLKLPFLLPEDGYSTGTLVGIPKGLLEFLDPLNKDGLCRVIVQSSQRDWSVYMKAAEEVRINEPVSPRPLQTSGMERFPGLPDKMEIIRVTFTKVNNSMGLSIVAAKGEHQKENGIYIKSVVPNGAADIDSRLKAGDQLIEVDGRSLVGITQEAAADLMKRTGQTVSLKVGKQGAIYDGLAKLLSQPSPVTQRGKPDVYSSQRFNNEEAPPPYKAEPSPYPPRHPPYRSVSSSKSFTPPESPARGLQPSPSVRDRISVSPALNTSMDDAGSDKARSITSGQNIPGTLVYSRQGPYPAIQRSDANARSTSVSNLPRASPVAPPDKPATLIRQKSPQIRDSEEINYTQPTKVIYKHNVPHVDYGHDERRLSDQEYGKQSYSESTPAPPVPQSYSVSAPVPPVPQSYSVSSPVPPVPYSAVERLKIPHHANAPKSPTQKSSNRPKSSYEPQEAPQKLPQRPSLTSRPKSEEIDSNKVIEWQERNNLVNSQYGGPMGQYSPNNPNISGYPVNDDKYKPHMYMPTQREPDAYEKDHRLYQNEPQFWKDQQPPQRESELQYHNVDPHYVPPETHFPDHPPYSNANRHSYDRRDANFAQPHQTNFYENMNYGPDMSANYVNHEAMENQREALRYNRELVDNSYQESPERSNTDRNLQDLHHRFPASIALNRAEDEVESYYPQQRDAPKPLSPSTPNQQQMQPHPVYYNEPYSMEAFGEQDRRRYQEDNAPPVPPPPQDFYNRSTSLEDRINAEKDRMMRAYSGNLPAEQAPLQHSLYPSQQRHSSDSQNYSNQPPHSVGYNRSSNITEPSMTSGIPQLNASMHNYQNIASVAPQTEREDPSQTYSQVIKPKYVPPPLKPKPKVSVSGGTYPATQKPIKRLDSNSKDPAVDRLQWIKKEIADLEAMYPKLSIQEDNRLQNLKLEEQFQKRLQEAEARGEEDSDDERNERKLNRELIRKALKEDIEKTKQHLLELHRQQRFRDLEREKEKMDSLQQRLKIYEEDAEHYKERQANKEEIKRQQREEAAKKQRDEKEKQRQEFEDNRKLLIQEEEKMRQRQEAEAQRRKEWENERLKQMQAARDAEEARLRAEAQKQQDDSNRLRNEMQNQKRKYLDRKITVKDEIGRLDSDGQSPISPQPPSQFHRQTSDSKAPPDAFQPQTHQNAHFPETAYMNYPVTQQNYGSSQYPLTQAPIPYSAPYPSRSPSFQPQSSPYQPQKSVYNQSPYQSQAPQQDTQVPVYRQQNSPYSMHQQQTPYQGDISSYRPETSSHRMQAAEPHQFYPRQNQQSSQYRPYQPSESKVKDYFAPKPYGQKSASVSSDKQQSDQRSQPHYRPPSPPTPTAYNQPDTGLPEPYAFNRDKSSVDDRGIYQNRYPPPLPERTSSYEYASRNRHSAYDPAPAAPVTTSMPSSRSMHEIPFVPKKTVSFNTQLETRNTYSVGTDDRSSTTSSQRPSVSSLTDFSPVANNNASKHDDVFSTPSPQRDWRYKTGNSPAVIGSQEVYNDPRNRVESTRPSSRKPGPEKMSFQEKMKYFAKEIGETTPVERPKASRSQRNIESKIMNDN